MIKQMDSEKQKEKIDKFPRTLFEQYADYVNHFFKVYQKTDVDALKQINESFLKLNILKPMKKNSLIKSSFFSFPETYKDYVLIWFPFLEDGDDLLKQNSISKDTSYLKELLMISYWEYSRWTSLYKQQLELLENYFNKIITMRESVNNQMNSPTSQNNK
jgi:hypothetical protein